MAFEKGHKKIAGRKKGQSNILTLTIKQQIETVLATDFSPEKVTALINKLEPKDKLAVYVKLLDFVVPKNNRVDFRDLNNQQIGQLSVEEKKVMLNEIKDGLVEVGEYEPFEIITSLTPEQLKKRIDK